MKISELPARQFEVAKLSLKGMSGDDIASTLGITRNNVHQALFKARQKCPRLAAAKRVYRRAGTAPALPEPVKRTQAEINAWWKARGF